MIVRKTKPLKDRLMEKIKINPEAGCWEWTGAKTGSGYGAIKSGGKMQSVHRASYEIHFGPIVDGLLVCHRCDNRMCVNPDHLFLGTQAENISDKTAKERQARGARHGCAKLTQVEVLAILDAEGVTLRELADRYGVGLQQIYAIRSGKSWSHLRNCQL